jgi:hypothetical protein
MKPVIIIAIAVVCLFVPTNVFGVINTGDLEGHVNDPNKMDFSIIFVTSKTECSERNYEALWFYASLVQEYLWKFNFPSDGFYLNCVTDDVMPAYIKHMTQKGDLAIIIPDYLLSVKDRHTTGSLGHYSSWNLKAIVSQAETLRIEDKSTG